MVRAPRTGPRRVTAPAPCARFDSCGRDGGPGLPGPLLERRAQVGHVRESAAKGASVRPFPPRSRSHRRSSGGRGRLPVAPQPARPRRTLRGCDAERRSSGAAGGRDRDSAVPHLRAEGELQHLLPGRRRQLVGRQPARHGRLRRRHEAGASRHLHGREHALRGADDAPADRRGGLLANLRLSGGGGEAGVGATSAQWKAITGNFFREGYDRSETSPVLPFDPASIEDFGGTSGLPLSGTDSELLDQA
jgi:hypothetical protein